MYVKVTTDRKKHERTWDVRHAGLHDRKLLVIEFHDGRDQTINLDHGDTVFFMNSDGKTFDRYCIADKATKWHVDVPITAIYKAIDGGSKHVWKYTHGDSETIFDWSCDLRTFLSKSGEDLLAKANCPIRYEKSTGKILHRDLLGNEATLRRIEDLPDPSMKIRINF